MLYVACSYTDHCMRCAGYVYVMHAVCRLCVCTVCGVQVLCMRCMRCAGYMYALYEVCRLCVCSVCSVQVINYV